MKLHILCIVGFVLCVTGCDEKTQAVANQDDKTEMTAPPSEVAVAESPALGNQVLLDHMHEHADRLDDLNFALADGDLEKAATPAYWLSQHEEVTGIPVAWEPFLVGMREAARVVENASDLEVARAAAERIGQQCQGCHAAAGISTAQ